MVEFERHAREISAFSSTSIEGNPLPLTAVKQILKNLPQNITDSQKEVVNYNDALVMLNEQLEKQKALSMNLPLILRIHEIVVKGLLSKDKRGALRNEPVFVNDPHLRKTIYWPPDHGDVPVLMNELINFVKQNVSRLDSIVLAGIFHKQFVVIHPFIDGNGRTVRLATKVLLAGMGLNTFNLFSFENYYNRNVTRYFQNVGVTGNYYNIANKLDFTAWLEYFAEGILDELNRVSKELDTAVIDPSSELKEYHKAMLAHIEKKGFITDREYARITARARPTRALDFNKMRTLGHIERFGKGKATYYKLKKNE
ncbi:MAG: hypothetical protein A2252_02160 [Elusimicrobia bacterium RIFOXYA2_FULL_39_19]|nr:MAG: hypothetical protein A2252_02160 [Elusimicrobia bacterium RIFOXYA2_FULL_39_19]